MGSKETVRFREFEVDERLFRITRNGVVVPLERRVYDLIAYLICHRDRVVAKDELLEQVWQQVQLSDSAVARCVSLARKALDAPDCIEAVYGRGYRWMIPISSCEDPAPSNARDSSPPSPIFGRDRELELTGALLDRAVAGEGGVCLVSGDAGIGKTRLFGAIRDLARRRGMRVLVGRSRDTDGVPPYWPWSHVMQALYSEGHELPEAVRFLLSLASEPATVNDSRVLLWEAVSECIREKAREIPTAILIDDLHQADLGAMFLFEFVAERVVEAPLVLAAAYRPAELERNAARNQVLQRMVRSAAPLSLELKGLTLQDTRQFLGAQGGLAPSTELVRRAHELTGGNPFFLGQVAPLLTAVGETWETRDIVLRLPGTVRGAIEGQLATLSAKCRSLLDVASVIGRTVSAPLAAAALELEQEDVSKRVQDALEAGLLVARAGQGLSFAFVHDLVREVVYEALSPTDLSRLHLRVARALEAHTTIGQDERLAEIAHHYAHAVRSGGADRAVEYAIRAAASAFDRFAYEAAKEHLERALALMDQLRVGNARARCDAFVDLGRAELNSGNDGAAWAAFERAADLARELGESDPLVRIALSLTGSFLGVRMDYDPRLVRLLEGLLARTDRSQPEVRALLLSRLVFTHCWFPDHAKRAALAREACDLSQRVTNPRIQASVAIARYLGAEHPGDLDDRLRLSEEAVRLCQESGEIELSQYAHVTRIMALLEAGRIDDVRHHMRLVAEVIHRLRLRNASALMVSPIHAACLAHFDGRIDDLEGIGRELVTLAIKTESGDAALAADAVRAMAMLERDRAPEALEIARRWVALLPGLELWRCFLTWALARAGEVTEAKAQLAELASERYELQRDWQWLGCHGMLSEASAELGDQSSAAVLYDRLSPYADRCMVIGAAGFFFGSVHGSLGRLANVLGKVAAAEQHFERAHAAHSAIGARLMLAHSLCHHTLMLEKDADPRLQGRAKELRRRAMELSGELRLHFVVRERAGPPLGAPRNPTASRG